MSELLFHITVDSVMGFRKGKRIPWEHRRNMQNTHGKATISDLETFVTIMEHFGEEQIAEIVKHRLPIVVADAKFKLDYVHTVSSFRDAIDFAKGTDKDTVIIGSVYEYEKFFDELTHAAISIVPGNYNCDVNISVMVKHIKKNFKPISRLIDADGVKTVTYERK